MKDTWLKDLTSYVEGVHYGSVSLIIDRHKRSTVSITAQGMETLRYTDNAECIKDIITFITNLLDDDHTGSVDFSIDMKNGQITLLAIKNTKTTKY